MTDLLVMYASKTGNAQAIAERVHEEAASHGWKSTLETMNKFKKLPVKLEENKLIVCVVSTTGEGEVPENGDRFNRFLKKKSACLYMLLL